MTPVPEQVSPGNAVGLGFSCPLTGRSGLTFGRYAPIPWLFGYRGPLVFGPSLCRSCRSIASTTIK
jgi:hypothetical protein